MKFSFHLLTFKCLQQQLDAVLVISMLLGEPAVCIQGQALHAHLQLLHHHLLLSDVELQLFTTQTQSALRFTQTNNLDSISIMTNNMSGKCYT